MSQYLIVKRGLYYRPDSQGYTGIKDNAGRYSLEEAQDHADEASGVSYVADADAPDYSPACFHDLALGHANNKVAKLRKGVEAAKALIDAIDQTGFGVFQVGGDDPELTICAAAEAIDAALAQAPSTPAEDA